MDELKQKFPGKTMFPIVTVLANPTSALFEANFPNGPLIRLGQSAGKGLGVFANEDLLPGTKIFHQLPYAGCVIDVAMEENESPIPGSNPAKEQQWDDKWANMSAEESGFLDKFQAIQGYDSSFDLFSSNQFAWDADDRHYEGLYLGCSRFNNSCSPNVAFASPDDHPEHITAITLKRVNAGDELLFNYSGRTLLQSRDSRRALYSKVCGFTCNCSICAAPDPTASDARRAEIRTFLEQTLPSAGGIDNWEHKIPTEVWKGVIAAYDEEGLVDVQLGYVLAKGAQEAVKLGACARESVQIGFDWLTRACEIFWIFGEDDAGAQAMRLIGQFRELLETLEYLGSS